MERAAGEAEAVLGRSEWRRAALSRKDESRSRSAARLGSSLDSGYLLPGPRCAGRDGNFGSRATDLSPGARAACMSWGMNTEAVPGHPDARPAQTSRRDRWICRG